MKNNPAGNRAKPSAKNFVGSLRKKKKKSGFGVGAI